MVILLNPKVKPKVNKRIEVIKIRAEINKIENRNQWYQKLVLWKDQQNEQAFS